MSVTSGRAYVAGTDKFLASGIFCNSRSAPETFASSRRSPDRFITYKNEGDAMFVIGARKQARLEALARIAHEAIRAYGAELGGPPPPPWDAATDRQRQDAIAGVEAVLAGQARSGRSFHQAWTRRLDRPDPPYEDLTADRRRELLLFRSVVLALIDGPCNGLCHDERCDDLEDHRCHLDNCLSTYGIPPSLGTRPAEPLQEALPC
jgi:hypothetical protein